jgi:hypothetical protein
MKVYAGWQQSMKPRYTAASGVLHVLVPVEVAWHVLSAISDHQHVVRSVVTNIRVIWFFRMKWPRLRRMVRSDVVSQLRLRTPPMC